MPTTWQEANRSPATVAPPADYIAQTQFADIPGGTFLCPNGAQVAMVWNSAAAYGDDLIDFTNPASIKVKRKGIYAVTINVLIPAAPTTTSHYTYLGLNDNAVGGTYAYAENRTSFNASNNQFIQLTQTCLLYPTSIINVFGSQSSGSSISGYKFYGSVTRLPSLST